MDFQHRMLRRAVLRVTDKALRDIPRDPRRSLRNLVDLGASCARGAHQKHFFSLAQGALASPASPYYKLISRMVSDVDTQRLRILAENLGGSALTYGVALLRRREAELGCKLPWLVEFCGALPADSPLFREANSFGCYTFRFRDTPPAAVCALARRNPDSIFFAAFPATEIAASQALLLRETPNVIVSVAVSGKSDGAEAFARLREARCFYGCQVGCARAEDVHLTGAEFQRRLVDAGCLFLSYETAPGDESFSQELFRYVKGARGRDKGLALLLFQLPHDLREIADSISPGSPLLLADPTRGLLEQLKATHP